MNRNILYDILDNSGLKKLAKNIDSMPYEGRRYYFDFVLDMEKNQSFCQVLTDWGSIENVGSIALCAHHLLIRGKYEIMSVKINYKDITTFEVVLMDDEYQVVGQEE